MTKIWLIEQAIKSKDEWSAVWCCYDYDKALKIARKWNAEEKSKHSIIRYRVRLCICEDYLIKVSK